MKSIRPMLHWATYQPSCLAQVCVKENLSKRGKLNFWGFLFSRSKGNRVCGSENLWFPSCFSSSLSTLHSTTLALVALPPPDSFGSGRFSIQDSILWLFWRQLLHFVWQLFKIPILLSSRGQAVRSQWAGLRGTGSVLQGAVTFWQSNKQNI